MLTDPFKLYTVTDNSITITKAEASLGFSIVDLSKANASVRKGSTPTGQKPVLLTISHSVTNENKGILTDRTLIRMDVIQHDDTRGEDVQLSLYSVFAIPRGTTVDSDGSTYRELANLMGSLLLFNNSGADSTGAHSTATNSTAPGSALDRIVAGEF